MQPAVREQVIYYRRHQFAWKAGKKAHDCKNHAKLSCISLLDCIEYAEIAKIPKTNDSLIFNQRLKLSAGQLVRWLGCWNLEKNVLPPKKAIINKYLFYIAEGNEVKIDAQCKQAWEKEFIPNKWANLLLF